MTPPSDNETWLIEIGDAVIQKKARDGAASLLPWEFLVYCLWVADYGMRNAGDLDTAADIFPNFQCDAQRLSHELSLKLTNETFSLPKTSLEEHYFAKFETVCNEIKHARPHDAVDVITRRPHRRT